MRSVRAEKVCVSAESDDKRVPELTEVTFLLWQRLTNGYDPVNGGDTNGIVAEADHEVIAIRAPQAANDTRTGRRTDRAFHGNPASDSIDLIEGEVIQAANSARLATPEMRIDVFRVRGGQPRGFAAIGGGLDTVKMRSAVRIFHPQECVRGWTVGGHFGGGTLDESLHFRPRT